MKNRARTIIASSRFLANLLAVFLLLPSIGILATLGNVRANESSSCSSNLCDCDTWYGLKRARCVGRHLDSIHAGVPGSVQALDLSDNSVSSLGNYELADAGLTNLKYLNLSKNSVSDIALEAFAGLSELTVLDLSWNHLYHVHQDVFLESRNLRILKLSRNNFNVHAPRLRCPWLTELDVHSCQISHIPADTFAGLTHLRSLDLTNNLMIQLDNKVLEPLRFLRKVSLVGNPWSCNRMLHDLEANLRSRDVRYDQLCERTLPGPKKFEKMILMTSSKNPTHPSMIFPNKESKVSSSTPSDANAKCPNSSTSSEDTELYEKYSRSVSPYWFLAMGFLLGCASSMVVSYLCMSNGFPCRRRRRDYRERFAGDPQRVFLLQNQWHVAEPTLDSSQSISCPGTPPPPYRDVMLRPGLYRAAPPATSNLNNNAAGYGT